MKSLSIPITVVLTTVDAARVDELVDGLVERIRSNDAQLRKLVLDSVSLVTYTQEQMEDISAMGTLKRVWFALTGGRERAIEQRITAEALYAAVRILERVKDQQLLTVELITLVENKLTWLQPRIQEAISAASSAVLSLISEARRELLERKDQVRQLQRSSDLESWIHRLALQRLGEVDYLDLAPAERLICAVGDFARISENGWVDDDLSLLRQALHELGLKGRISAGAFFATLAASRRLLEHLFQGTDPGLAVPPAPEHTPFLAATMKLHRLGSEEQYLFETIAAHFQRKGAPCTRSELLLTLVKDFLEADAGITLEAEFSPFSLAVDLLSGMRQLHEQRNSLAVSAAPPEPEPQLLSEITVRELARHLEAEPKELVSALRLSGRLEREEDLLPLGVAGAIARNHEVRLPLAEPHEAFVDPLANFEWIHVAQPAEGLLPGNIPTDGRPLPPFSISASPVTRRQFTAALQRVMDRYAFKVGTNSKDEYQRTKLWIKDGILWLQPAGKFADRDEIDKEQPEHKEWARWLFILTQSGKNSLPYSRVSHLWATLVEVPLLHVKSSSLRLENSRFVTDRAEEEKPVTGVTFFGTHVFLDQLERAGLGKFSLPSARHYAALNRGLSQFRTPLREWCVEEVLYSGVHHYDSAPSDAGLANTGLRVIRKEGKPK